MSSLSDKFKSLSGGSKKAVVAAATAAAVIGGGYLVANSSALHRGKSGFGSCTTAADVCESLGATSALGAADAAPLKGNTIIVTGGNSGIGMETARALALHGAKVVMPCRSMAKAEAAIADITSSCEKKGVTADLVPGILDLSDLDSVRAFAESFLKLGHSLKALVCNAGIMALPERKTTKQGFEAQMGTCHLGHFLLSQLLLEPLRAAAPSRVVFVSSMGHRLITTPSFMTSDTLEASEYEAWRAYGVAKMSNVICAREFNERHSSEGITAYSLHPGGIHTNLQTHVTWRTRLFWAVVTPFFFKNTEQGAATSVFCAIHPKALESAGGYHEDCNASKTGPPQSEWLEDKEKREAFWATSLKLVGL